MQLTTAALLFTLGSTTACAVTESSSPTCDEGKCDVPELDPLLRIISVSEHDVVDDVESFRLLAVPHQQLGIVPDASAQLDVEMWLVDGDANSEFKLHTTLDYSEADGGYLAEGVDISLFTPWKEMRLRVRGLDVDQTFELRNGDTGAYPESAVQALEVQRMFNEPGVDEQVRLILELEDAAVDVPDEGDEVAVELWTDGGPTIRTTLVYDADNVGQYISDFVDITDLIPYRDLRVRLRGALRDGQSLDSTFVFHDDAGAGERF